MQHPLSVHAQIPTNDVDHSWQLLRSSLTTAGETLLRQPRKPHKPWISEATMQLADHKQQLWKTLSLAGQPSLELGWCGTGTICVCMVYTMLFTELHVLS